MAFSLLPPILVYLLFLLSTFSGEAQINDTNELKAYLVLSMGGERADRQSWLHQLCCMAYCYLNLKQIIGIATEPLNVKVRSYDVYGLHGAVFENSDELVRQAKNFFSKPYQPNITEYQGRIDDA